MKRSILIAGVGGASLGTELFKSLRHSGNYNIFGADISPYAYGLYQEGFVRTYVVDRKQYTPNILDICRKEKIDAVIPGGEEPLLLLCNRKDLFDQEDIALAINSKEVIELCTNKIKTFEYLSNQGIPVPLTKLVNDIDELNAFNYPVILKPTTGSGGSTFVCLAEDRDEALLYVSYLRKRAIKPIAQEYIPHYEGEYTVGVLSLPNREVMASIALKRSFNAKLSCLTKYDDRVISSGYSQGLIEEFPEVRQQAEIIAVALGSTGPLNIQGRLHSGILIPFEINPRFSASTYLRTMAGFNEVDVFLQFLLNHKYTPLGKIKYGYYLRSLEEKYIHDEWLKK